MGLRLNKITDDVAREELEWQAKLLKGLLAKHPPQEPSHLERYYSSIGDAYCEIGLLMYQQEQHPKEIRESLVQAAQYLIQMYSVRNQPMPNEHRNPWDFQRDLSLVICFGSLAERKLAAQLHVWQYCSPPDLEYDALVGFLENFKAYACCYSLDMKNFKTLEMKCVSDGANKDERGFVLPGLQAIRAMVEGNATKWEEALTLFLKSHEAEAKRGEYKLLSDGLVCLPALALVKVGQENGLRCSIKSPYLPLSLLEG